MQGKLLSGIDRTVRMAERNPFAHMIPILLAVTVTGLFSLVLSSMVAWAGPLFVTDDPEPVEYRHG